ncbi:MAG: dephospho-CoA kinase [Chloroherpetonaceae bacterium]|nr:dephospho-CoA kinase [Chloroherpetonaceae bacterium]MCS7211451.1 dephospho-CoA kinase [Chloroherpetonaceae bacterium]MDW8020026.1 dephospho-CoA kinase [Chloroherpetonaceae bacterium]MDW8466338.1 dephospho-CoA kinase [Chloroherpetonaceae bacterium]
MKVIGVTGGIGSGKSTVCDILRTLGCEIFNADLVAKQLQETDSEVIAGIKQLFGADIYEGGVPNRKKMAEIAFCDAQKLEALSQLIHPKVFLEFERARKTAEANGAKALVKEAAILFESGGDKQVDETIVVLAPRTERIRRLEARGMTRQDIEARMARQLSDDELRARADYVIENTGSLDELRAKTMDILNKILSTSSITSNR